MNHFFEIVELSNGDIVLRTPEDDEQAQDTMVTIQFSEQVKETLKSQHIDVARVMIEAGIRKVGELSGVELQEETVAAPQQLH